MASFDIVFQEVPGEVTLALNLSCCPHRCSGCHSRHLWEDVGEELTEELLLSLFSRYENGITCVCFMGGDADQKRVFELARLCHQEGYKTAWYSGDNEPVYPLDDDIWEQMSLDFLKIGSYVSNLGGLKQPATNQRFYKRTNRHWEDMTRSFWSVS